IVGSNSTSAVIPEAYLDDGPRTVVVHGRVTDKAGGYTDFTDTMVITNVAPKPQITLPPGIDVTIAATFAASTTDPSTADTNAGFKYSWDFGDGTSPLFASGTHIYAKAGTYTVTLTATDKDGGVGTATASVTVKSLPTATFTDPPVGEGSTTAT